MQDTIGVHFFFFPSLFTVQLCAQHCKAFFPPSNRNEQCSDSGMGTAATKIDGKATKIERNRRSTDLACVALGDCKFWSHVWQHEAHISCIEPNGSEV